MGDVFLAEDRSLKRLVAIKVLAHHFANDPAVVARFLTEARAMAALNHPNIVKIYRAGESKAGPYFAMPFVAGGDLQDQLEATGAIESGQSLQILKAIGSALDYAHESGIVHRDIKPAKILIDEKGIPSITDFGIVRITGQDRQTQTGAIVGTPEYMSPEQWDGKEISSASDRYSFGVLAYEVLSGKPPFSGPSQMSVGISHLKDPVPDIQLPGHAARSIHLQKVFKKMLAKAPNDRYDSCEGFCQDLSLALKGEKPTVSVSRMPKNGNQRLYIGATAILIIAIGIIAFALNSNNSDRLSIANSGTSNLDLTISSNNQPASQELLEQEMDVPHVEGISETEARNLIASANLDVTVTPDTSVHVPAGTVISQSPNGGTKAAKSDVVRLVVSTGSPLADQTQGIPQAIQSQSDLDRKVVPPSSEGFGYTLIRSQIQGKTFWVPEGWNFNESYDPKDHDRTFSWQDPSSKAFIRVDCIDPTDINDILARYRQESSRFQSSPSYRYHETNIRTGSDAYKNGMIWNFTLKKGGGPVMKRAICYFYFGSADYAVSTGYPDVGGFGFGRLMTDVMDSVKEW